MVVMQGNQSTAVRTTVNKITADHTRIEAAPTFYGWSWVVDFAADSALAALEGER